MDLAARFQQVATSVPVPQTNIAARFAKMTTRDAVSINKLEVGRRYLVTRVTKQATKYGPTVMLVLKVDPSEIVKVFLPERFTAVFEAADMDRINDGVLPYYFVFHGRCPVGLYFILALEN